MAADSFIRRLCILEMLKRKDDGVITIPEIIIQLSNTGTDDIKNKTVERDMVHLSTLFNIGCDNTVRPFHWWWAGKNAIEIPGMGRNSALTFKLCQQYLEPLLPKKSLAHLQPKFRQSKNVLAGKGKEKDRRWINKIRVVPRSLKQLPAKVSVKVQDAVYEALYEEKMLQITYQSRAHGEITTRRIHPLALIFRGITSELIFCEEGEINVKRFILNRIKGARVQIQSVIVPKEFNLEGYIEEKLGFPGSCEKIQFKAWLSDYGRQNVEETPLSKFQTIEESEDGGVIVTANIRETASLTTWILGLGTRIKVLEPISLQEKIAGLTKSMSDLYQ